MKNDDLRADRDELDHFVPRSSAKRGNNLVLQVAGLMAALKAQGK